MMQLITRENLIKPDTPLTADVHPAILAGGRTTLPRRARDAHGIVAGDRVLLTIKGGDELVITKVRVAKEREHSGSDLPQESTQRPKSRAMR